MDSPSKTLLMGKSVHHDILKSPMPLPEPEPNAESVQQPSSEESALHPAGFENIIGSRTTTNQEFSWKLGIYSLKAANRGFRFITTIHSLHNPDSSVQLKVDTQSAMLNSLIINRIEYISPDENTHPLLLPAASMFLPPYQYWMNNRLLPEYPSSDIIAFMCTHCIENAIFKMNIDRGSDNNPQTAKRMFDLQTTFKPLNDGAAVDYLIINGSIEKIRFCLGVTNVFRFELPDAINETVRLFTHNRVSGHEPGELINLLDEIPNSSDSLFFELKDDTAFELFPSTGESLTIESKDFPYVRLTNILLQRQLNNWILLYWFCPKCRICVDSDI